MNHSTTPMNNSTLIYTTGALFAVSIISVVIILIFYDGDKVVAVGFFTSFLVLAVPVLMNLRQSAENAVKLDKNTAITEKTHIEVNSRVTQLIEAVKQQGEIQKELSAALALAQGIKEGRAQAKEDAASPEGS